MASILIGGTAAPADVLTGKTFSAGANYSVAGTIPTRLPDSTDQIAATNISYGAYSPDALPNIYLGMPSGQFISPSVAWARYPLPNLVPSNVKAGVDIAGCIGTMPSGKRFVTGSQYADGAGNLTVTGLPFQPTFMQYNQGTANTMWGMRALVNGVTSSAMYNYGSYSPSPSLSAFTTTGFTAATQGGSNLFNWIAIE